MKDNGTVTYRYRQNYAQPWKTKTVRARIAKKRIYMLPMAYDMTGKRFSSSIPAQVQILSYQRDGKEPVIIRHEDNHKPQDVGRAGLGIPHVTGVQRQALQRSSDHSAS